MAKYYIQNDPLIIVKLGDRNKDDFQVEKILKYSETHYEVSEDLKTWRWRHIFDKGVIFNNIVTISGNLLENIFDFDDDDAALLYSEVI